MKQTKFAKALALSVGVLVFSGAISFLIFAQSAWQPPTATPPGDNVAAPLNIGDEPQVKSGDLGIGSNIAAPTQKLDVDGYIKGRSGLCIGDNCRATWQTECNPNEYAIGINADGTMKCKDIGGTPPWENNSCDPPDPALNMKRVFVTSTSYTAGQVGTAVAADNACADVASGTGLIGTYKALIYAGASRTPTTYLPAGKSFWTCGTNDGTTYEWKMIASNSGGFFDAVGGNYLDHAINYTENGMPVSKTVWTNFAADGSGIPMSPSCCSGSIFCQPNGTVIRTWYGNSSATDSTWAKTETTFSGFYNPFSGVCTNGNCNLCYNQTPYRGLYCVEQ